MPLIRCCFRLSKPRFDARPISRIMSVSDTDAGCMRDDWRASIDDDLLQLVGTKLNISQKESLVLALRAVDIAAIQG